MLSDKDIQSQKFSAKAIFEERTKIGLSIEELAKKARVEIDKILDAEKAIAISISAFERICSALEIDPLILRNENRIQKLNFPKEKVLNVFLSNTYLRHLNLSLENDHKNEMPFTFYDQLLNRNLIYPELAEMYYYWNHEADESFMYLKELQGFISEFLKSDENKHFSLFTTSEIIFDYLRLLVKKKMLSHEQVKIFFCEYEKDKASKTGALSIGSDCKFVFPKYKEKDKIECVKLEIDSDGRIFNWPKNMFNLRDLILSELL